MLRKRNPKRVGPKTTGRPRTIWVRAALALLVISTATLACGLPGSQPPSPAAPTATREAMGWVTESPADTAVPPPTEPAATSPPAEQPTIPPPTEPAATSPPAEQPTDPPSPTPRAARPLRMNSPEYGMQAFLWWRPETADRDLSLIHDAGFGWVKQALGWRDIEPEKGQFDWSRTDRIVQQVEAYGLDLLVRVDQQPAWAGGGYPNNGPPDNPEDFGNFLYAMASRYRGRIRAYQVWNEPNLNRPDGGGEWGGRPPNATEYVALLKVAYRRIKEADPEAIVISAGLTPTGSQPPVAIPDDVYLEQMYQAMDNHSSEGYFDVLGVHAPGYKAPPEMSPDEVMQNQDVYGHGRWFCFRRVEDLRAIMVRYGDEDKQVAVLEFGWTSDPRPDSPYNWHAVTEEEKGEYMVRAYQFAKQNWAPWIGLMSLVYVCNPDWTEEKEEYWWAITYPDFPGRRTRIAYEMLKEMPK